MPFDGAKPKDKGDTGLLIALGGPEKPGRAPMGSEPDDADAPAMGEIKSMASADAMAALESGDAVAFEDALTRFVKACSSEDY